MLLLVVMFGICGDNLNAQTIHETTTSSSYQALQAQLTFWNTIGTVFKVVLIGSIVLVFVTRIGRDRREPATAFQLALFFLAIVMMGGLFFIEEIRTPRLISRELDRSGSQTKGTVLKTYIKNQEVWYEFVDHQNMPHKKNREEVPNTWLFHDIQIGEQVDILYFQEEPSISQIAGNSPSYDIIFPVVVVVFLLIIGGFIVPQWQHG